jgi:cell division protein FtsI/penicillin-binding protein 2
MSRVFSRYNLHIMKPRLTLVFTFVMLFLFAVSCKGQPPTPTPTITPTPLPPTPTLGEVSVEVTPAPDPSLVAEAYLAAWKQEDYSAMYNLLTRLSRDAITQDAFTTRYRETMAEAAASSVDTRILAAYTKSPYSAEVSYQVILHSVLVGDIQRDTVMNLGQEDGQWRVQWDSTLILPELTGENRLQMEVNTPSRGNIYDRNGSAIVAQADAWALGLDTGKLDTNKISALLSLIYEATKIRPEALRPKVEAYSEQNYYLPVADLSSEQIAPYYDYFLSWDSVLLTPFRARYYFDEGIAPHVTGYVRVIHAEEVEEFKRLGYNPWSDRVGEMGLEDWGEPYLGGKRGGTLKVIAADKSVVTILASTEPQAAQAIYTTIDKDLQEQAQLALNGFRGAIVVLERNTGRVLALASSPGYNPNLFEPSNYNSSQMLDSIFNPETTPLLNRATLGQYPLGSVFKIITISAALQSGLYTPETEYNCRYDFTELPGITLYDWTWEHYLKDGRTQASGLLTLPQGLMKSCDPYFYHIGLDLFSRGMTSYVSDIAHGFGLGSPTGIQLDEEAGQVLVPNEALDATWQAIGQSTVLVTPLQVANFVAAVGNGGTLYQPSVVEKIVTMNGDVTYEFTSTIRGTLPISPTYLQVVQNAMVTVLGQNGTARSVGTYLNSYNIHAAGKTGTAQTGVYTDPHAWFAGYTFNNNPDKPDIAVAVLLENAGEGSEWAAPIFKAIVRLYFYPDQPREPFAWEKAVGVWRPTPTPTSLPSTAPEATPTPVP